VRTRPATARRFGPRSSGARREPAHLWGLARLPGIGRSRLRCRCDTCRAPHRERLDPGSDSRRAHPAAQPGEERLWATRRRGDDCSAGSPSRGVGATLGSHKELGKVGGRRWMDHRLRSSGGCLSESHSHAAPGPPADTPSSRGAGCRGPANSESPRRRASLSTPPRGGPGLSDETGRRSLRQ